MYLMATQMSSHLFFNGRNFVGIEKHKIKN